MNESGSRVKIETRHGITVIHLDDEVLSVEVEDERTGSGYIHQHPAGDVVCWPRRFEADDDEEVTT